MNKMSGSGKVVYFPVEEGSLLSFLDDNQRASGVAIVDFTAKWCGPCKAIAPHFAKMAKDFPDVLFVKVDVDECEEVTQEAGIEAMPTFQSYVDGKKKDELCGADLDGLVQLLSNALD